MNALRVSRQELGEQGEWSDETPEFTAPPGMPFAFGVAPRERFIIEELPETQVQHGVG